MQRSSTTSQRSIAGLGAPRSSQNSRSSKRTISTPRRSSSASSSFSSTRTRERSTPTIEGSGHATPTTTRSAEGFVDDGAGDVDVGRGHESLELAAGVDLDDLQPIAGLDQIDAGQAGADGGAGAQGEVLDVGGDRDRVRTRRRERHSSPSASRCGMTPRARDRRRRRRGCPGPVSRRTPGHKRWRGGTSQALSSAPGSSAPDPVH